MKFYRKLVAFCVKKKKETKNMEEKRKYPLYTSGSPVFFLFYTVTKAKKKKKMKNFKVS